MEKTSTTDRIAPHLYRCIMPIAVCSHLRQGLLVALCFLSVSNAWGQTYKTFNTATAASSGTYYAPVDTNNYAISQSFTQIFAPETAENMLRFTFSAVLTESFCHNLKIYCGPSTASALIGSDAGTTTPGNVTASNATGQLTFVWTSDDSVLVASWAAAISVTGTICGGTCYDFSEPSANYIDGVDDTNTFLS